MQKMIGSKFTAYIDSSSVESFDGLFKESWQHNTQREVGLVTKARKKIPVLLSVNALLIEGISVLSIILTDLTIHNRSKLELKQKTSQLELKNIELENANKDLTMFTYISSHDLQEPLRKIQSFTSIIFSDTDTQLSKESAVNFERIRNAAKRMQALIEDLLTYSRAKNIDRKFEKVKLNQVVDDVMKEYEELILDNKATLEVSDLGEVTVIQFQIHQLISNLIGNSLKFLKPQTDLHITIKSEITTGSMLNNAKLSPSAHYCHITYSDNGIGFDQQYSERIFEVFQRLHSRNEYKGTGMGLAICKRIMENHNGVITATGKLGVGAQFDIYLPVL
jgi:light-regulated signal transduction histidine kinase (bacteriophytochrome)